MKKLIIPVFCVLVVIFFDLLFFQIKQEISIEGFGLEKLETELVEIKRENTELTMQILEKESFITIKREAEERGFVPATMVYIAP